MIPGQFGQKTNTSAIRILSRESKSREVSTEEIDSDWGERF
jgi:hypothetical protein